MFSRIAPRPCLSLRVCLCLHVYTVAISNPPPCHFQLTNSHCLQLRSQALDVGWLPWLSGLQAVASLKKKFAIACKDGIEWYQHMILNTGLSSLDQQNPARQSKCHYNYNDMLHISRYVAILRRFYVCLQCFSSMFHIYLSVMMVESY